MSVHARTRAASEPKRVGVRGPVLSCAEGAGRVERFTHSSAATVSLILVRRKASIYSSKIRRAPHV